MAKKKNNFEKSLDMLANVRSKANDGERLPTIRPGSTMKDSDARQQKKRGDRGLKHKPKYDE